MDVNELIDAIYDFVGDENEWLEFEKHVQVEMIGYSELDLERLEQSDAMEHLLMICDEIRF